MKKIFPCLLALTLALTLVLSGCGQDSYTTTLSADKVADKLLEVLSGRYHGAALRVKEPFGQRAYSWSRRRLRPVPFWRRCWRGRRTRR